MDEILGETRNSKFDEILETKFQEKFQILVKSQLLPLLPLEITWTSLSVCLPSPLSRQLEANTGRLSRVSRVLLAGGAPTVPSQGEVGGAATSFDWEVQPPTEGTNQRGISRHFAKSRTPSFLTFSSFLFMGLSWVQISAVTKSARSNQRFFSYSLGNFGMVGLQRYLHTYFWSEKRSICLSRMFKTIIWLTVQLIGVFISGNRLVSFNDLGHVIT